MKVFLADFINTFIYIYIPHGALGIVLNTNEYDICGPDFFPQPVKSR